MLKLRMIALAATTGLVLSAMTGWVMTTRAQAQAAGDAGRGSVVSDLPPCDSDSFYCHNELKRRGRPPKPNLGVGSSGGKAPTCVSSASGIKLPCTSQWGSWSNDRQCYLRPDPSPSKPAPSGKTGRWYLCHRLDADPAAGGTELDIWLDEPPSVDPGGLALDILAELQLQKIRIGITPEQGKTGLLGLPTYLWVDNAGPRTLGPITDSDTQGNVTVTLTAKVDHVTWTLGDGTTITCTGAGTPYQDSFGAAPSPTCGHIYRKPSTDLEGGATRSAPPPYGGSTGPAEVTQDPSRSRSRQRAGSGSARPRP